MAVKKNSGRILKNNGRVLTGTSPLIFKGTSSTFPFAIVNNSAVNTGVGNLNLTFNRKTTITVDYGDGTVKSFVTSPLSGSTVERFVFNSNDYYSDLYTQYHAKYTYSDGLVKEREVKIIYDRSALLTYNGGINGTSYIASFNFLFYAHRNLTSLITSSAGTIGEIPYLDRITTSTNPALAGLSITNWATTSPYISSIPINFLDLPLTSLGAGSTYFTDTSGTNIEYIGVKAIRNSLISLTLNNLINMTDLPASLSGSVNLRTLTFSSCAFTVFPAVITQMTWLTGLVLSAASNVKTGLQQIPTTIGNLTNLLSLTYNFPTATKVPDNINLLTSLQTLIIAGNSTYTEFGNIPNLINLATLTFQHTQIHNAFSSFPTYFNSFTKLRQLSWANNNNNVAANVTKKVSLSYDLVTRNAPMTGATNGTVPFRGMTWNLVTSTSSPTAIEGEIVAPSGFVLGSNNGIVDTTGKMLYVATVQYGVTLVLTS